jgi:hypothetical protein
LERSPALGELWWSVGAITQWYIAGLCKNLSFAPLFAVCAVVYLIAFILVTLLTESWDRFASYRPSWIRKIP